MASAGQDVVARCLPQPDVRAMATAVRGDHELGAVVSPFLRTLADHVCELPPEAVAQVGAHTLELLSTTLSDVAASSPRQNAGRTIHLRRARRHITDHLGDPELTPRAVAEALGLSVRYLHAIFQAEGTSPARWIVAQRLERAAALLADRRHADHGITEIAFMVGFKDATHLTRAFRTRYGRSPREYRRAPASATGPVSTGGRVR